MMPNISVCRNEKCEKSINCSRYTPLAAIPYLSYFDFDSKKNNCFIERTKKEKINE